MSDGPYKSLPMSKPWRKFAELAETPAYSTTEVQDALCKAVLQEVPVKLLEGIASCLEIASFFPEVTVEKLEAVRAIDPGSTLGGLIVDAAIQERVESRDGACDFIQVVANGVYEYVLRSFRSVEEHYLRKAHGLVLKNMRARLAEIRNSLNSVDFASRLLGGQTGRPEKRAGIEDGPTL
jgi:hypothetical protein